MNEHERDADEQLELPGLVRAQARKAKQQAEKVAKGPAPVDAADERPVARVLVDVPLAHLDRPFDYLVPRKLDAQVVPGCRVKVRFAGQDVDGFVLDRVDASEHEGRLAPLRRSVSPEPVLAPWVARLSELVAARYAGTRSDVLRLAVPPRHATVEKQESVPAPAGGPGPEARVAAAAPARSAGQSAPGSAFHTARGCSPRASASTYRAASYSCQGPRHCSGPPPPDGAGTLSCFSTVACRGGTASRSTSDRVPA